MQSLGYTATNLFRYCLVGKAWAAFTLRLDLRPEGWVRIIQFQDIPGKGNKQHLWKIADENGLDVLRKCEHLLRLRDKMEATQQCKGAKRGWGDTGDTGRFCLSDQWICASFESLWGIPQADGFRVQRARQRPRSQLAGDPGLSDLWTWPGRLSCPCQVPRSTNNSPVSLAARVRIHTNTYIYLINTWCRVVEEPQRRELDPSQEVGVWLRFYYWEHDIGEIHIITSRRVVPCVYLSTLLESLK